MHDLASITALGGTAPLVETVKGVTLTEVPDLALASVAARKGHEAACIDGLGVLLNAAPPEAGKAMFGAVYDALWMGPNQWLLGADLSVADDIAKKVKEHLTDTASVTEQTDAWVCFDLSGTGGFSVLELLCNVNLLDFGAGNATRTSIHHLGCFVVCKDPDHTVRILGPRASAKSLHHALKTAMASAL